MKINHTESNLDLMNQITVFLKNIYDDRQKNSTKNKESSSLWSWAVKAPLQDRIDELFGECTAIRYALEKEEKIIDNGVALDLGCGFCPYWPFLNRIGFNKFIGFDLYSKRGKGDQKYMSTAKLLVETFCKDFEYIIVEDDVRNIESFNRHKTKHYASNNGYDGILKHKNFDLVFTKNTDYTKAGSTGIPENIFDNICNKYLKNDGIVI